MIVAVSEYGPISGLNEAQLQVVADKLSDEASRWALAVRVDLTQAKVRRVKVPGQPAALMIEIIY